MEVGVQLGQTKMLFLVCSPRVTRIQAKHFKFLKGVHSGQFLGGGDTVEPKIEFALKRKWENPM